MQRKTILISYLNICLSFLLFSDFLFYRMVLHAANLPEILLEDSSSDRSKIWSGDIHTVSYQFAGYEHQFLATPYIEILYRDVPANGIIEFLISLKLSESHRYRAVGDTSWTVDTGNYSRRFLIDNVQLTWNAGENTAIVYISSRQKTHTQGIGLGDVSPGMQKWRIPVSYK